MRLTRRGFLKGAAAGGALFALPRLVRAQGSGSSYSVAVLGDTHFDQALAPEFVASYGGLTQNVSADDMARYTAQSTYHRNWTANNQTHFAEFIRNGDMWRERCPRLIAASAALTGYGTTAKLTFADGATAVLEGDLTVTNAMTAAGALSLTRAAGVETNVTVAATGTLTASGAISVGAGVVFVVGANHPTATLTVYDNATLDLSRLCTNGVDVVFDAENTTFQPGSTVYVKLGDRTIGDQNGKKLASWSVKPSGVKFVCGDEGRNCMLAAESDGLYIYRGFSVFLY